MPRWLVACVALVALALLAVGALAFRYRRLVSALVSPPDVPATLETPRVLVGQELVTKTRFLRDSRPGVISDIAVRDAGVWLVGSQGALVTDRLGKARSFTAFERPGGLVEMVDVEGDGISEFLNRGGGWQEGFLLDRKGRVVWTYGGHPAINDITAGDLDGDGLLDFVAGFNGGGGVRRIDRSARPLWRKSDGNVWRVEIVPKPAGTGGEIVHSNAGGEIKIRGADGNLVKCVRPESYFADFSLCRWPDPTGRDHLLYAEDDAIWLYTTRGVLVKRFAAPHAGELGDARGTPVTLPGGGGSALAVVVDFSSWERSVLYIYGPEGGLKYQEVLAGHGASIAEVPAEAGAFLVGGDGVAHLYRMKPDPGPTRPAG
jgi:hypothetical protein